MVALFKSFNQTESVCILETSLMMFSSSQHSKLQEHDIIIACRTILGTHIPIPTKSAKLKNRQKRFSWLKDKMITTHFRRFKLKSVHLIWEIRL